MNAIRSLLVACLLSSAFLIAQENPSAPAPAPCGKLVEKDGTKILYLWGSAEERGHAEGLLLGDVIFATLEEFALSENVVPSPMMWDAAIRPLVENGFAFDADFEAWARGMLRGIKEKRGGKIQLAKLKRDLTVADLKVVSCIPDLAGFMCSSFAVWGDRTANGSTIVGRNLDYYGTPTMTRNSLVKVHAATAERSAWVGIGWAGLAGCLTGYSANGTWIAIHDVYVKAEKDERKFTSRMFALEEILRTTRPDAKPVVAALKILRARRFALGGNGMFAWDGGPKARGAAVLEFDGHVSRDEGAVARRPESGQTWVACSNHHRIRSEKGHGCYRYKRLLEGAASTDPEARLDLAKAWKLIRRSSIDMTIYRAVADLGAGRIEIERRLEPGKDVWSKRLSLDAKALLREVSTLAHPTPPPR